MEKKKMFFNLCKTGKGFMKVWLPRQQNMDSVSRVWYSVSFQDSLAKLLTFWDPAVTRAKHLGPVAARHHFMVCSRAGRREEVEVPTAYHPLASLGGSFETPCSPPEFRELTHCFEFNTSYFLKFSTNFSLCFVPLSFSRYSHCSSPSTDVTLFKSIFSDLNLSSL